MMATLKQVERIASRLPGVTAGNAHRYRSWDVGGKAFAWERGFSKADLRRFGDTPPPSGPILAVRVEDLGEKEAVLSAHPDCVFTIPHFDGYAAVLIQLEAASTAVLDELIVDGWLAMAPADVAAEYLARVEQRARRQHRTRGR
jgi:hypothetical protein